MYPMKVKFSIQAKNRLDSIYQYYVDTGLRKVGRTNRSKIISRTFILREYPFSGPVDEYAKSLGLDCRYLVEGDYKVIYSVQIDEVRILDIFDTRQDPEKMKE